MPRFVTARDVDLFRLYGNEMMNKITDVAIIIYSFIPDEQNANIYGESINKYYRPGIVFRAYVESEDESTTDEDGAMSVTQTVNFSFLRRDLLEKDFYPDRGDIIEWNYNYYEITNVVDNKLLAGRDNLKYSITCDSVLVNRSAINIRVS